MELESLSLIDLRNLAKDKGIQNVSKLKKSELIEKIMENYNENNLKDEKSNFNNFEKDIISETTNDAEYKLTGENDEYVEGILELLPDGYGFLRGDNYLSTTKDVYVSPVQIRRFKLDTGDKVKGIKRTPKEGERFPALIFVGEVNGEHPEKAMKRPRFDEADISRVKAQILESLKRQDEYPDSVLDREMQKELYGSHPYARNPLGEAQFLKNLTKVFAPSISAASR